MSIVQKMLKWPLNKESLIRILNEKLIQVAYSVHFPADADTLIVNTAINESVHDTTVVVGQDIDLLLLLVALTPSEH